MLAFRKYEMLLEDYLGKNSKLIKCEELIDRIIPVCSNKSAVVNDMREVIELEHTLRNIFNFKSVVINFYHQRSFHSTKNAYTHPSSFKQLDTETVVKNRRKYFNKSYMADPRLIRANVNICTDLITEHNLTSAEVMAIILHELGHDVDASAYNNFVAWYMLFVFLGQGAILGVGLHMWPDFGNNITRLKKWIGDTITRGLPFLSVLMNFAMKIFNNAVELEKFLAFLMIPVVNPVSAIPAALNNFLMMIPVARYQMENSADSFATKYGYGPDLARALNKIGAPPDIPVANALESMPIIRTMKEISEVNLMIVGSMLGVHPQNITRINNQIKLLEDDLKDPDIPSSYKKDIERDIAVLRKIIESDMMDPSSELNKGKSFRAMYVGMIYKMGGNTDLRDLLPKARL